MSELAEEKRVKSGNTMGYQPPRNVKMRKKLIRLYRNSSYLMMCLPLF